ncbi:amidohydrolase [Acuticoccus mangrovi]|uniref:Amidohydrolase family protein n=1 Tax=Acuticoccus mangrovi TaxID=2796142 RepID=A0A934MJE2_9HYPH|nr:amidohydrolase [Acuticoccus mangrovi]MBJ3778795.1 amidohydrolase family protein [Acuticoccus mangrovi]
MTFGTLLKDARLPDGRMADIALDGGTIAAVTECGAITSTDVPTIDIAGACVLPGLVDGHMHLDKTLMGLPWVPHQAKPFRMSRIETDKWLLPSLDLDTKARALNLIDRCISFGTAHIRTHVDIDLEGKLTKLAAVLEAREEAKDKATVQIVAFPQSGVSRRPGTLELLDAALAEGADLIGGIDPCEIDRDPKGQLDGIFALAEKYGVGVDIHLHEAGELGLFNVQEITERTRVLGLAGKVTISHGFCLGGVAESRFKAAAEAMGEAGVMVCTHGAAGLPLPPIMGLREAGVNVFAGNDDVRDSWSPYGDGDMLARAALIGWRADLRTDEGVLVAFDLASAAGAKAIGIEGYGVAKGCRADFFTVAASGAPEAVGGHPPRDLVVFNGNLVARGEKPLATPVPLASLAEGPVAAVA